MHAPIRTTTAATVAQAALVGLLLALGPLAASPASAADGDDVTWGVSTADTEQGADRQNYDYAIDPGATVSDALVISNHDTEPLDLDLYGADGFTAKSGQLDAVTRDVDSAAVGAWVSFAAGHIQIAPGASVEAPFTLSIPENATPGDYAGAVITSLVEPSQTEGISVDRRLGIRIHLRVGGELEPALALDDVRVDYAGSVNPFAAGEASVSYTVRNTGNAQLTAGQSVRITGPFGMLPADAAGVERTPDLLPGESWTMTVPVRGVLPAFLLSAKVAIVPGLADAAGTVADLVPVEASATTWAVPWALLALVLLVAAGIAVAMVLGRRRRARRRALEDARVEQAVEEALRAQQTEESPVA
jgi:hypothetical protein